MAVVLQLCASPLFHGEVRLEDGIVALSMPPFGAGARLQTLLDVLAAHGEAAPAEAAGAFVSAPTVAARQLTLLHGVIDETDAAALEAQMAMARLGVFFTTGGALEPLSLAVVGGGQMRISAAPAAGRDRRAASRG